MTRLWGMIRAFAPRRILLSTPITDAEAMVAQAHRDMVSLSRKRNPTFPFRNFGYLLPEPVEPDFIREVPRRDT